MSGLIHAITDARDWMLSRGVNSETLPMLEGRNSDVTRLVKAVIEASASEADLCALDSLQVETPMGRGPIQEGFVARVMLARALDGAEPAQIVEDALDFARTRQTDFLTIQCLTGIVVDQPIDLDPGLALVPRDHLPDTPQRHRFFPSENEIGWRNPMGFLIEYPTAALTFRWLLNPAVSAPIDPLAKTEQENWAKAISDRTRVFEEVLGRGYASVALATEANLQRSHRYYEALHPGYPAFGHASHPTLIQKNWRQTPGSVDAAEAKRLYALSGSFEPWSELSRLIRRFARARAQDDPVDAHLDLGVVAESILTHGDQEAQGEIRNRVSTRAAWLLGDDPGSRRAFSRQAKRLYDLRSAAAHDGRLPTKRGAWTKDDQAMAERLCANLLRKTLQHGSFVSDWDQIVFG